MTVENDPHSRNRVGSDAPSGKFAVKNISARGGTGLAEVDPDRETAGAVF
jgi:hypothetical protein